MAVTAGWYGPGMKNIQKGAVDLDTDSFKAMITTVTYVPDVDAHEFRSSITNEVSGTGYTAGGVAITTPTVTYDSATNEIRWDFDDPAWTGVSFTAGRIMVIYKARGGASSADELVMWVNFGADQTPGGANFSYLVPATGAAKTTV